MKLVTWLKSLIVKPVNKVPTKTQFKLVVKKPCLCCEPNIAVMLPVPTFKENSIMLCFIPKGNRCEQVHIDWPSTKEDNNFTLVGMIRPAADKEGRFYFTLAKEMACFEPKHLIAIANRINFLEEFYESIVR